MASVTLDAPAIVVGLPTAYVLTTAGDPRVKRNRVAVDWGRGPRDQLIIVEAVTERPLAELRSAVIDKPTWTLNGIGGMGVQIPVNDPTLLDCLVDPATVTGGTGELNLLGREAQFWRNGELRWAGPIVAGEVDMGKGVLSLDCWDLGWYLSRKFIGAAERRDKLNGLGQMEEAGLPGWTRTGVTMTRTSSTKARGTYSAQMIGEGAATASFSFPAITSGQDGTVLVTAMVKLSEAEDIANPILSVKAVPAGGTDTYRPAAENWAEIDEDTLLGGWTRVSAVCHLKPNVANDVTVALWSNSGAHSVWFDDVRVMRNDTVGIPSPGSDLTDHGRALVNHVQSIEKGGGFGLAVKVFATCGVVEVLGVRHIEHPQLLDLFDTYVNRDDGWDWWLDPQRRRVCFAPRRGQDQVDVALSDRSVVGGGWVHDESEVASSVVVLGEGDGIDRPEGGYEDTSGTAGLSLDYLDRPPNGTRLSALDPRARSIHAQRSQPQTTLKPMVVPATWWEEYGVSPGDVFGNHLTAGVLRPAAGGGFRVQQVAHDLASDTLELT